MQQLITPAASAVAAYGLRSWYLVSNFGSWDMELMSSLLQNGPISLS